jgi:hypothetical protein
MPARWAVCSMSTDRCSKGCACVIGSASCHEAIKFIDRALRVLILAKPRVMVGYGATNILAKIAGGSSAYPGNIYLGLKD